MPAVLLDTHALLWWRAGGQRLSAEAARAVATADPLLVSPVSLWEIATLLGKGRIALDRDIYLWASDVLGEPRVQLAPLTAQAAVGAGLLGDEGFPGDPADRMIYATARDLIAHLVTKDVAIRGHAARAKDVRVVW